MLPAKRNVERCYDFSTLYCLLSDDNVEDDMINVPETVKTPIHQASKPSKSHAIERHMSRLRKNN